MEILSNQIKNGEVKRQDLNTTTVGSAVVAKVLQGTGITISSSGADAGTGDVTISINATSYSNWNSAFGWGNHAGLYTGRAISTGASLNSMASSDTRGSDAALTARTSGMWLDFKNVGDIGLSTGLYAALITFAPFADNSGNIHSAYRLANAANALYYQGVTLNANFSDYIYGPWQKILMGNIANQQIAFGNGTAITGSNNLKWDGNYLITGTGASSAIIGNISTYPGIWFVPTPSVTNFSFLYDYPNGSTLLNGLSQVEVRVNNSFSESTKFGANGFVGIAGGAAAVSDFGEKLKVFGAIRCSSIASAEQMALGGISVAGFALTGAGSGSYGMYAGVSDITGNAYIQVGRTNSATAYHLSLQASGGRVSIGKIAPTEMLDVFGNIRYSGTLKPNGVAGVVGQILSSGGTTGPDVWVDNSSGVANVWTPTLYDDNFELSDFSYSDGQYLVVVGQETVVNFSIKLNLSFTNSVDNPTISLTIPHNPLIAGFSNDYNLVGTAVSIDSGGRSTAIAVIGIFETAEFKLLGSFGSGSTEVYVHATYVVPDGSGLIR